MIDVLGVVPGMRWPAIPDARSSQLLAMQFQLEQSQWLSDAELLKHQLRQASVIVEHARATVPFYARTLASHAIDLTDSMSREQWSELPLLRRRDLQIEGTELHSTNSPKEHGQITRTMTSGSTGEPVTTLGTSVTRLMYNVIVLRQHLWLRRDLSKKLAAIRAARMSPDGPQEFLNTDWGPATRGVARTGPGVTLDIHTSTEEQAAFLLRHDPEYLLAYPSVIEQLGNQFRTTGQRLCNLREIRSFGEVLEPTVRDLCQRVWGVPVTDSYSAEEVGEIASQCERREGYHIQGESLLVEVLNDRGEPCQPGEVGRVVITSLNNFAMPLIRYEIGDLAEVGQPCPCGRGLPVLSRILGRQRNMFVLPDGRRVWPSLELGEGEQVADMPPILQYQMIQRSLTELELLVVSPRQFTESEVQLIRTWCDRTLSQDLALKITYVERIARGPTGKYEDFKCEVNLANA